ncbi:MAG: transketolase [Clostridia bacterium]|nr:transketolase [Clostridia bacterium]
MDVKQLTVNTIRVLSAEGIDKANSGHPGLPLGAAPIAYTLFANFLKFNPRNPKFENRDRFILSAGHGSMMLYSLLHLFGYNVKMDDLKNFRQFGSITPGHPEYKVTPGVEVSTGPLGQGIANAVGMAMAEKHLAAKFNREGYPIVDHYTYALCGDGCMQEGIEYEAASLAGTLKLNKLIVLYDKNNITIEGNTDLAFTENVGARHAAQGWNVITVKDGNDINELKRAIAKAKKQTEKPSLIICYTKIGFGSAWEGSEKVHGTPLGEENTAKLKENLGYDYPPFTVQEEVKSHLKRVINKGKRAEKEWKQLFKNYEAQYPDLAREFRQWMSGKVIDINADELAKSFTGPEATRNTSFAVLNQLENLVPNLFGGSADLAPSNKSYMKNREYFSSENANGSNIHFGIREHAMAAICNGISVHGGLIPYCATFFVFSDYMKNSIRLAALMKTRVIYVLTHDSIGVGEDGPTHQPIEQLASLRSIPGLNVFRPADGKETAYAWLRALNADGPTAIVLTRQNLPQYDNSNEGAAKGGYIISNSVKKTPACILLASGSEVELCFKAKEMLHKMNIDTRIVSMPCFELFERQSEKYKQSVLPPEVTARVVIEAGCSFGLHKYAGDKGEIIAIDSFGESAPYKQLFTHYGFTPENVCEKVKSTLNKQ